MTNRTYVRDLILVDGVVSLKHLQSALQDTFHVVNELNDLESDGFPVIVVSDSTREDSAAQMLDNFDQQHFPISGNRVPSILSCMKTEAKIYLARRSQIFVITQKLMSNDLAKKALQVLEDSGVCEGSVTQITLNGAFRPVVCESEGFNSLRVNKSEAMGDYIRGLAAKPYSPRKLSITETEIAWRKMGEAVNGA